MKLSAATALLVLVGLAVAQRPPPPSHNTCSNNVASFGTPAADTAVCETSWKNGGTYAYPADFKVTNARQWYECHASGVRVLVSNGIPDHNVTVGNPNTPCDIPWFLSLPLNGTKAAALTEPANLGIIAVALNGVPIYGAQESGGTNAVEPAAGSMVQDAQYWYGHAAPTRDWHYHNPYVGNSGRPSSDQLVGFALDGYPIYGPLADASVLDGCNGREVGGAYRYHVRDLSQVDGSGAYCSGNSPAIKWNYVLGCYAGSLSRTTVKSSTHATLPSDCVPVDY